MTRSLPLRTGFFRSPQITDSEQCELLEWARSLVTNLSADGPEWAFSHDKKDVQIYQDRQKGGLFFSVKSLTTINATLDDAMDIIAPCTTTAYRSLMSMLLKDDFGDSSVIFHRPQNDAENLSIKWLALRSRTPMAADQDFCFLEYSAILTADIVGGNPNKTVGVCLYESIDQTECPSLFESHKIERGSISRCGFLFRPTEEPGILEVQFVCSIRQPQNARSRRRSNRHMMISLAESIHKLQDAVVTHRISRKLAENPNATWVRDRERQCCHLCFKTFGNVRRKHHCRACGEIICGKCSTHNDVTLPSIGLTTLRICKSCVDGNKPVENDRSSFETTSTEVSSDIGVNEYALALPSQNGGQVPDRVGLAWLRQVAMRNPEKKRVVESLLENMDLDDEDFDFPIQDEDAPPEDIYDVLCDLASQALDCDFAVVSLIDENRQWFKSKVNILESEIPRDFSFCEYPVRTKKPLIVRDTLYDKRFEDNAFVTGPLGIRFVAGAPLFTVEGDCVGSVCVLDTKPRNELKQVALMEKLAQLAMASMQGRRNAEEARFQPEESYPAITSGGMHIYDPKSNGELVHTQQSVYQPPQYPASTHQMTPLDPSMYRNHGPSEKEIRERQELESRMHKLLFKSQQTREQVDMNQKTWNSQSAGLRSSAE